ncbi:MAG: cytochrome P450 [Acidimicrobiia bacterium]
MTDEATDPMSDETATMVGLYRNEMMSAADRSGPQPGYLQLLEESGGISCPFPGFVQAVSREAVVTVLGDRQNFSSAGTMELGNIRPMIPLQIDPPEHSKFRKLLDPLFAPKVMDAAEADLTQRINYFIDKFIDRGECNFTDEFAELFPSAVFLGLMGLPWEELDTFLRLRDGILRVAGVDLTLEEMLAKQKETGKEIYEYFGQFLDDRERNPQDDILTHFLQADVDGDRLTREDILDICFLFLIAGLDTVSDSLTCFFAYLAQHPEQRQLIVDDASIIPNAVEELLRWETPVPGGVPRKALKDTEVCGFAIEAGTMVLPGYGTANVDPAEFPDGFEVRFDRESNPHIAFGAGIHRCLGSHLARRELRLTLREWHRRIPVYGLKPGHEELVYPPGLRSVKDLMLSWPI